MDSGKFLGTGNYLNDDCCNETILGYRYIFSNAIL